MTTVQVSSAEVIWLTRAFSAGSPTARSAERASTGTIALASAPPRISWYRRSGIWFAVTYAVPRNSRRRSARTPAYGPSPESGTVS